jgi:hypothetical protein
LLQFTALYKNNLISKIAALLLLLLFVVGNAPIQLLHDAFANHKDYTNSQLANNGQAQVVQNGIHCQCDHFVIESAFAIPAFNLNWGLPDTVPEFSSLPAGVLFAQPPSFFAPRGPPAIA